MQSHKRYSPSTSPVYARVDGTSCWLQHNPCPEVRDSASFQATPRSERRDHRTRSYELGRADQYYSCICRGIDDKDMINLYSSEQQARDNYTDALTRYENDSRWQRV
jgi:hypothetical protein